MQDCECKLWDKNIDQYNDMFNFVEKYHGPSYEGDDYTFCPWCGTDLQGEDEDEYDEDEDEFTDDDYEDEEEDDEIDTTPMHGDEEEDDDEDEEEFEVEFEPEAIEYPVMLEGWVSVN